MRELLVDAEATIAARDYGGTGQPLLLLHGGGGNLAQLTTLAGALRPDHRVVLLDLRGHGRSSDGPWEWDDVLDDLAAVADELDLDAPAVAGMSLGGMVAAHWATRHPECPGAISFDGVPPPSRADRLPGLPADQAAADLTRLRAEFTAMTASLGEPMTTEQVEAGRAATRAAARQHGAAEEERWVEAFERGLTTRDGVTRQRLRPETAAQLRTVIESFDPLPVLGATRCPLLLLLATTDLPQQRPYQALYAAHRRWLDGELAIATRNNSRLEVARLAGASHAMVAEGPVRIAELITDFLASRSGVRSGTS